MSDFEVLRRIAERGKNKALREESDYVDLFQHMLDEIERCRMRYQPKLTKKQLHDLINGKENEDLG